LPPAAKHAAHRILQAQAIAGLLADFDIGEVHDHRFQNTCAPAVRVVEALDRVSLRKPKQSGSIALPDRCGSSRWFARVRIGST
jgi:hypothetical protein